MIENIYKAVKEKGIGYSSYHSDLYIPRNEETTKLVNDYKFKNNVTTFTNQVEGGIWYDIPFAYSPYWDSKLNK